MLTFVNKSSSRVKWYQPLRNIDLKENFPVQLYFKIDWKIDNRFRSRVHSQQTRSINDNRRMNKDNSMIKEQSVPWKGMQWTEKKKLGNKKKKRTTKILGPWLSNPIGGPLRGKKPTTTKLGKEKLGTDPLNRLHLPLGCLLLKSLPCLPSFT